MSRDRIFDELETMWTLRDPMPDGLVERMQAVAAAEMALSQTDLDYELMLLVERSSELAGTRGRHGVHAALRAEGLDLLVRRVGANGGATTRWTAGSCRPPLSPSAPARSAPTSGAGRSRSTTAGASSSRTFPRASTACGWTPRDDDAKAFGTPTFEI